jgi:uncharacterized lipoprotein YmbA
MQKGIFGLLLIVFIASCATMPETRIYSLSIPAGKKAPAANIDAVVTIIVSSPRYLSQPYMAYRTSPYQLAISRYAKWDSPPDEIVRDAVRDSISSGIVKAVKTSGFVSGESYALKIDLKRFERLDEGDLSYAEIALDVSLMSPEGKNLYQSSITKKIRLEDRSFLSLAKGLSSALGEGTEEVRGGISSALKK